MNFDDKPNLSDSFPFLDPDLKIKSDLDNPAHPPHFDAMSAIDGGIDKIRISPEGEILGGTTQIGMVKMDWE